MAVADNIYSIAHQQGGLFTRKQLVKSLRADADGVSERSLAVLLNRMIDDKKIVRVERGVYQLNSAEKQEFVCSPTLALARINDTIRCKFPFVDYCVWHSSALAPLMQHVPAVQLTLVDVERAAMEAVFLALQATEPKAQILLNPSKKECERYISNSEVIVVRPFVKEAPCRLIGNCSVPTMEKMLVDAIAYKELQYLHGNEIYTVFRNAFDTYSINRHRLLRYASRRNRKSIVEQILSDLNL